MDIRDEIKIMLASKRMTMTELAKKMTELSGKNYSQSLLSHKLKDESLRYSEMKLICKILGYRIYIDFGSLKFLILCYNPYIKEKIMSLRNERVRKELMRDISEILRKEIRGLEGVVSIVDVEVSHDNSYAKVIYSVLGSDEQIEKSKEVIEKSTSKIRYEVGKRLRLRLTPELRFVYSNGLEEGSRVTELINKISRGEI